MVHGRASLPRKPGVAAQHSPFGDGDGVRQGRVVLSSIVDEADYVKSTTRYYK
jgi:hypothetical protein